MRQSPTGTGRSYVGTCADLEPNPAAVLDDIDCRPIDPEGEDAMTCSHCLPNGLVPNGWTAHQPGRHVGHPTRLQLHESEENIQNHAARDEIGGISVDGSMVLGLNPAHDPARSAIADIQADGDDDTAIEACLAAPPTDVASPLENEATPVT